MSFLYEYISYIYMRVLMHLCCFPEAFLSESIWNLLRHRPIRYYYYYYYGTIIVIYLFSIFSLLPYILLSSSYINVVLFYSSTPTNE